MPFLTESWLITLWKLGCLGRNEVCRFLNEDVKCLVFLAAKFLLKKHLKAPTMDSLFFVHGSVTFPLQLWSSALIGMSGSVYMCVEARGVSYSIFPNAVNQSIMLPTHIMWLGCRKVSGHLIARVAIPKHICADRIIPACIAFIVNMFAYLTDKKHNV